MLTYTLSRTYLVEQRQTSALRQTRADARLVRSLVRAPDPDVELLLRTIETSAISRGVVRHGGRWYTTSATEGPDLLPAGLRAMVVEKRVPARQRYRHRGAVVVTVGIPLEGTDAYFEIFPLVELSRTLKTLQYSLAAAALATLAASVALGLWATGVVLRPVREIGRAAQDIAGGKLDARLDVEGDEELAAIATGFNHMVATLQTRIERDARFTSDVSHELRSPLTTLRSAVHIMAARRDELDPRSARAFDLLSQEVDRFERTVEELLEMSRYDAGIAQLRLEPVDIVAVVEDVLRTEGVRSDVLRVLGDGPVLVADRRRLEQVVRNLVGNAEAHGQGLVSLTIGSDADIVTITVEDGGPGIPVDERETVFERFHRGVAAGRRSSGGGVGLGLALVAEHVQLHGGTVHVVDAEHGASIVVELPVAPA